MVLPQRAMPAADPAPVAFRVLAGDADALFKEARRRRRLRWLYGTLIAVVVIAIVIAIGTAHGSSGGRAPGQLGAGGTASGESRVFTVKAASMEPTLSPGDQVEVTSGTAGLERGDIVEVELPARFQTPGNTTMIKRIIGLPGETISSSGATVLINGVPLPEPYIAAGPQSGPGFATQVIPPGEYFVLGDNRADSLDSRYLGPIPQRAIVGIAARIVAPPSRAGPIPGTPRSKG
jgi:signal peptidase I